MNLRFYLDEDVDIKLAKALQHRSVNIITTQQAENRSHSDYQQLIYANEYNRIITTHNTRDFMVLHKNFLGMPCACPSVSLGH